MSIDVAIIDSGINPWHSHVQGVDGGLSFRLDRSGRVVVHHDFLDGLGHGTAIAGIIRGKVPSATLHAVKIFHDRLEAPIECLLEGLKWAIEQNMKIIHLSLGTEREGYRTVLEELCDQAYKKDLVILAAARGHDDRIFPAVFPTVIGTYWNRCCEQNGLIHHPENDIEFGSYGRPRAIPGLPERLNFCGHSFAVAHVTAEAAQLLERHPDEGASWVKNNLAKGARKEI